MRQMARKGSMMMMMPIKLLLLYIVSLRLQYTIPNLGIGLELACNRASCRGISLTRDKLHCTSNAFTVLQTSLTKTPNYNTWHYLTCNMQ